MGALSSRGSTRANIFAASSLLPRLRLSDTFRWREGKEGKEWSAKATENLVPGILSFFLSRIGRCCTRRVRVPISSRSRKKAISSSSFHRTISSRDDERDEMRGGKLRIQSSRNVKTLAIPYSLRRDIGLSCIRLCKHAREEGVI